MKLLGVWLVLGYSWVWFPGYDSWVTGDAGSRLGLFGGQLCIGGPCSREQGGSEATGPTCSLFMFIMLDNAFTVVRVRCMFIECNT